MSAQKWFVGVLGVIMTASIVCAGEEFYLVRLKGYDKQVEVSLMSAAEFKVLDSEIKLETKLFPKAVADAGKEWRADELNKGIPFAGNKLSPRLIMGSTKYSSNDKATEALSKYDELQSKKTEREFKKKKVEKSKAQSKQDSETAAAAEIVKAKLASMIAKGAKAGTDVEEDLGGAKVGAAVNKVK